MKENIEELWLKLGNKLKAFILSKVHDETTTDDVVVPISESTEGANVVIGFFILIGIVGAFVFLNRKKISGQK